MLATAVKVLYSGGSCFQKTEQQTPAIPINSRICCFDFPSRVNMLPNLKYKRIQEKIASLTIDCAEQWCETCYGGVSAIKETLCDIIWKHHDIPLRHLDYIAGVRCVAAEHWNRDQQWDNVYSFYDPTDRFIKIRKDQFVDITKIEVALLIAIGESLLGDYAASKVMEEVVKEKIALGKVYHLLIKGEEERNCYFTTAQLSEFMLLARMHEVEAGHHYTRLINGDEGFTPPGLLMGLTYTWYLENRLATHIEYKMTVMKIPQTDLIPEQKRMVGRRERIISFFRDVVFSG
jgi:hypothetical protein